MAKISLFAGGPLALWRSSLQTVGPWGAGSVNDGKVAARDAHSPRYVSELRAIRGLERAERCAIETGRSTVRVVSATQTVTVVSAWARPRAIFWPTTMMTPLMRRGTAPGRVRSWAGVVARRTERHGTGSPGRM